MKRPIWKRLLRWLAAGIAALLAIGVIVDFLLGPWEPVDLTWRDPGVPGIAEVDGWLAASEAEVHNLRPDAAKRIVWADAPAIQTPLSVVVVHGFSASAPELDPVPRDLARFLGANLHYTRLTGHGRDSASMTEPQVADWAADLAEAIDVGRVLGERVILIGSSMGGALVTLAALDQDYGAQVAGLALIAPAYRLPPPAGRLITLPFARQWGPLLFGETRVVTPRSDAHAQAWTLTYPTTAVLPLGALVRVVGKMDKSQATIPAIFVFSDQDTVVDPQAIRAAATAWGAPRQIVPLSMGPGDDPAAHVIAGDILSPGQNEVVLRRLAAWAREL